MRHDGYAAWMKDVRDIMEIAGFREVSLDDGFCRELYSLGLRPLKAAARALSLEQCGLLV